MRCILFLVLVLFLGSLHGQSPRRNFGPEAKKARAEGSLEYQRFCDDCPKLEANALLPASAATVVLYELGLPGHGLAESAFRNRTGVKCSLNAEQARQLARLLNASSTYGGTSAACHDPALGVVWYDADTCPVAYLSICLNCNNVFAKPALQSIKSEAPYHGFSASGRRKLIDLLTSWDRPYLEYSFLFDDEKQLRYLEKQVPQRYPADSAAMLMERFRDMHREQQAGE